MQSWMVCVMRGVGHDGVDANADTRMRVCGQYGDVIARYVSLQRKEKKRPLILITTRITKRGKLTLITVIIHNEKDKTNTNHAITQ